MSPSAALLMASRFPAMVTAAADCMALVSPAPRPRLSSWSSNFSASTVAFRASMLISTLATQAPKASMTDPRRSRSRAARVT